MEKIIPICCGEQMIETFINNEDYFRCMNCNKIVPQSKYEYEE